MHMCSLLEKNSSCVTCKYQERKDHETMQNMCGNKYVLYLHVFILKITFKQNILQK